MARIEPPTPYDEQLSHCAMQMKLSKSADEFRAAEREYAEAFEAVSAYHKSRALVTIIPQRIVAEAPISKSSFLSRVAQGALRVAARH